MTSTLRNLMSLKGRTALVTGAGGHLGRVIIDTLGEQGANLILVDLPGSNLENVVKNVKDKWDISSEYINCDLENHDEREEMIEFINSKYNQLNILINNAAFVGTSELTGWATRFEHQNLDVWRRGIEVNLTAAFHLCQGFASVLGNSHGANILNIGSIYGEFGPDWRLYEGTNLGNPASYAVSKGGIIQLTRWLATTLAPNIRVNCMSPGGIFRNQHNEFLSRYCQKVPLGRMAVEDDFRGGIAFLTSDLSAYMTGQNIAIDGGWGVW